MSSTGVRERLVLVACTVVLSAVATGAGVVAVDGLLRPPAAGRVLSADEMLATFGDGQTACASGKCVKQFNCYIAFVDGSSNCAKCDSGQRSVCCESTNSGDQCDYTGSLTCAGYRHVGPRSGPLGSCDTCSSSAYKKDGQCQGIRHAQGTPCS